MAYHVAKVEEKWEEDVNAIASDFINCLRIRDFFQILPLSPVQVHLSGSWQLVLFCPFQMIWGAGQMVFFKPCEMQHLIQQTGGGNGFSFSSLRPSGSIVKASSGKATGPIGFLRVYDNAFGEVAQGGTRRGANMAVLRVDHPDIEEFIQCKTNENAITNFNISVGITDAFMQAVENDAPLGSSISRCTSSVIS